MAICSTEFAVLQPHDERLFEYLYLFCISRTFRDHLVAHATGSTGSRQRVRTADLLAAPVFVPHPQNAGLLGEIVSPLRKRLGTLPNEAKSLSRLVGCISDVTNLRFAAGMKRGN